MRRLWDARPGLADWGAIGVLFVLGLLVLHMSLWRAIGVIVVTVLTFTWFVAWHEGSSDG